MTEHGTISAWTRFWERGGWWQALLLVASYFVLYQAGSLLFLPLAQTNADPDSAGPVAVDYVLPILLGVILLALFSLSTGWLKELFQRQPISGRGWMWIAVAAVIITTILRFATIDYGSVTFDYVATWLLAGLMFGIAEEVLTRGFVVNLMRKAAHKEIAVALVSAALFAALHDGNLVTGQNLLATSIQIVFTFAIGLCMCLALRVTGNLIWPILLHASTDPRSSCSPRIPPTAASPRLPGSAISSLSSSVLCSCSSFAVACTSCRTRPSTLVSRGPGEELARLLELGARAIDDRRMPDGTGWVVLADPEGNEFCILRSDAERAS